VQRSPKLVSRARRVVLGPACLFLACGLLGYDCQEEVEPNWTQFNGDADSVTIEVGAAEELDAVSCELTSSVTGLVVGSAEVSPGGGPIGTEHTLLVVVEDDWENDVGRVSVRTDSGDRGSDEYELESDPADEGYYGLTIISVGEEGEQRSDTLTFRLWYDSEEETTGDDTGA
jgi:hypothetical protein